MTDIREVSTDDTDLLHQFWEIGWSAHAPGRPWHTYRAWPSARSSWQFKGTTSTLTLLAAYDGAEPVGYAEVRFPQLDNIHLVEIAVAVRPDRQRQGHGTALGQEALDRARAAGRRTAWAEVFAPIDGDSAGLLFAASLGFPVAQASMMKATDLVDSRTMCQDVVAETAEQAAGFTFVTWMDRCPDELVAPFCDVGSRFLAEIPLGDLDLEPETWSEARIREKEARFVASQNHETTTLVLAADGTAAGYTEMMVSDHRPDLAFQGATVVLPAYRGHRLGIRLKALNHLAFTEARPDARTVLTGNASENTHMNAINERLGFRDVERDFEVQRSL